MHGSAPCLHTALDSHFHVLFFAQAAQTLGEIESVLGTDELDGIAVVDSNRAFVVEVCQPARRCQHSNADSMGHTRLAKPF